MKKLLQFLIINTTIMMISCQKDDSGDMTIPGSTNSAQINATISGRVTDESGASLQGVNIIAYGNSASTDANGIFLIKGNVAKERCVLEFNKAGYMKRLHAIIASSSKVNYVNIVLQNEPTAQSFQSASGGSVTLDHGGSVTFPANAFVIDGTTNSYSGLVTIKAKHISPDNSNFSMLIPGGDLSAVDANGDNVSLYSYGMAGVTITGSGGENLQLATGSIAIINFPIATTQTGTAPQTIPLWYLDERDALWKEEGAATRVGNNYVEYVEHFTWWNCDYGSERATIIGRVVDCVGNPFPNITVTVNGQITFITDQDGYYTGWVPTGMSLSFVVLPQGVILLQSQTENVPGLANGQNFTIPDLLVQCEATITGQLTNCNGEKISGYIYLKENNVISNYQIVSDGSFSLLAIPNRNISVYASSESGYTLINVSTPGFQQILDLGELHLCNQISTSFTINGNGYTNTLVHLDVEDQNYATYNGNKTGCVISGITNVGDFFMTLHFDGNNPTTVDATFGGVAYFSLNGIYYEPLSMNSSNHLIYTITEYGVVGDWVKGTFQGDVEIMSGISIGEIATITNGKFAFIRTQ